jgi:hypothetical protein
MTESDLARKNHAAILRRLSAVGLKAVADVLGVHESTVSRMKDPGGLIESSAALLASLHLSVIDECEQTYDPEIIKALHTMARLGFEQSPEIASIKK